MVKFVSLDTSTSCSGMVLWINGKLNNYKELKPKGKTANERIMPMAKMIYSQLDEWKPDVVYLETPQGHGNNIKLAKTLGEVIGVVISWCANNNKEFNEISPSQWRNWVGMKQGKLKRDALKKLSISMVKELFDIDAGDDVCDAILLGQGVLNYFSE